MRLAVRLMMVAVAGRHRWRVLDQAEFALALLQPFMGFPAPLFRITVAGELGFQRRYQGRLHHDQTSYAHNARDVRRFGFNFRYLVKWV